MSLLFSPIKIRDVKSKNRIFVSPMCQYSAVDGKAEPWHLVHLGGFAKGGAGLVMVEATAVSPAGRISPGDLGLWNQEQTEDLKPIVSFIHSQHSVSAIQLAHAGRKAGTGVPWTSPGPLKMENGHWPLGSPPLAPSPIPFAEGYCTPQEMNKDDLLAVKEQFVQASLRAQEAGFQVIEIHMAHGYLLHEFLSPITNHRSDEYGGSLENRIRYPLEVTKAVREIWPSEKPLFVRISATDWILGGWDLPQSIEFCKELKKIGVDLIDVSTGGISLQQQIPNEPLYQVPFAKEILREVRIKTGAVGLITDSGDAERILQKGEADVVFIGRELLRDPHWPLRAARELQATISWPNQYLRAKI
jgi:2,4-dienoyl-CoA reductase-like NADH-dependent reductase (Old Yellow Enzyme family)